MNSTVSGCVAFQNGEGIWTGVGSTITGCAARENSGVGIGAGTGSTVSGCTAHYNGTGIYVNNNCHVLNNNVYDTGQGIAVALLSTLNPQPSTCPAATTLTTTNHCAYGANVGWVNFESTGAPKVDLATGNLSGYAWNANCGWISLSNAAAAVQTAFLAPGTDVDDDGIADGWELTYTNTLTAFTASSDTDHDGLTDQRFYRIRALRPLMP